MRPAKVDAATVGDALVGAFRNGGYAGASLRDLTAASGLKSASLYHRFPNGKADMALAALARAGEAFGALVLEPLDASGDVPARLAASAAGAARFYEDGALACLIAVMTLSDAPEPVRAGVRAMLSGWTDALAAILTAAHGRAARAEAEDRIAGIQGALIFAQAGAEAGAGAGAGVETGAFARAVGRLGAP